LITILLIGHLNLVELKDDYTILEFYAGQRRAARLGTQLGQSCAAMDILYDAEGNNKTRNNSMDINTSAGFTFPT
jgi:hypothetical protein